MAVDIEVVPVDDGQGIKYTADEKTPQDISVSEAARILAQARGSKVQTTDDAPKETIQDAVDAVAQGKGDQRVAPPKSEPQGEDNAQPEGADPVETKEAEPEELPPIEPPRSWNAQARERWSNLPRETQAYLADREAERERVLRQGQNEAAERLKAIEAEKSAAEKARQQYESALPVLLQTLQHGMNSEFSDIRTMQDLQRLAAEDPPRYLRWDAHQKQLALVQQELMAGQQRAEQEKQGKWQTFAEEQDKLFQERVPDAGSIQDAAIDTLEQLGFTEQELGNAWNGKGDIPLRDVRMQELIRKATLWDQAQLRAKTVAAQPKPPVQRPGASRPQGSAVHAQIQALATQLESATGNRAMDIAFQLQQLRKQAGAESRH